MTPEERHRVLDGAVAAWEADFEKYSLAAVADASGIDAEIIRAEIGDELDVLDAWYALAMRRVCNAARAMESEAAQPVEDRIGSRLFMLFDTFEEHATFVHATFDRRAGCWGSPFRDAVGDELASVLQGPDVPGVNLAIASSAPIRGVIVETTVQTISLWLEDDSESRGRATAFVDRLVTFLAGLAADRTIERGIDLVKYAAGAGYIPFVGDWFKTTDENA